ncbi:hypothetical protein GCM10017673_57570 [Streptosporangium violaceochromogenes]|nr:hypothetical protein GCM10017673_57570 [Streptosporangium violaceochromogenes]
MNQPARATRRHIPVHQIETTHAGNGLADVVPITGRIPSRLADILRGKARMSPEEAARVDELFEQSDQERFADAAARREAGRARLWARRCTRKYQTATYDQFHPQQDPSGTHLATRTETAHAVTGWLDGTRQGLLLKGPSRHGKSYCAYAIGHVARASGLYVTAWSMPVLNKALRGDFGEREGAAAWGEVMDADLLILDDVGQENITSWTREQLHVIAEHRLTAGDDDGDGGTRAYPRRTIITTNFGYTELVDLYGDPLVERLLEDATVAVVEGKKLSAFAADPF